MAFNDYQTALVTGASSGIGEATARRFAAEGLKVLALGRDREKLDQLRAQTGCDVCSIDISDTMQLTDLLANKPVDVVVNSAGVGRSGTLTTASAEEVDDQVDVNLRALLHVLRLTVPGMIERNRGHVVNVSSMAATYNFVGNSVYHATKSAVHALSRQLRIDAFGHRVRVTEICPGRVKTPIFNRGHGMDAAEAQRRFFDGYEVPTADEVADAIAYAVGTPSHVNVGHIEIMSTFQVPGHADFGGAHFLKTREGE